MLHIFQSLGLYLFGLHIDWKCLWTFSRHWCSPWLIQSHIFEKCFEFIKQLCNSDLRLYRVPTNFTDLEDAPKKLNFKSTRCRGHYLAERVGSSCLISPFLLLLPHYVSLNSMCYNDTDVSLLFLYVTCKNVTHGKLQREDYRDGLTDRQIDRLVTLESCHRWFTLAKLNLIKQWIMFCNNSNCF